MKWFLSVLMVGLIGCGAGSAPDSYPQSTTVAIPAVANNWKYEITCPVTLNESVRDTLIVPSGIVPRYYENELYWSGMQTLPEYPPTCVAKRIPE